jgi:hypothetical protein
MKILSRDEMKNVMGGFQPGGAPTCKTECSKWDSEAMAIKYGSCSQGTQTIGNTTAITCDCSLSSGSSCYNV